MTPPDVRARARGTGGPRPRADPLACRFLDGTSPLYLERCIPAVLPRARARRGPGRAHPPIMAHRPPAASLEVGSRTTRAENRDARTALAANEKYTHDAVELFTPE